MKYLFQIIVLLYFTNNSYAQEQCNDEIIMAVKGKWAKRPDATMQANNQAQVVSRIDKMQQIVQAAYPEPKGTEANWYRSMGGYYSSLDKNLVAYNLNTMFYTWYCNIHVKKLLLGTEASNSLNIWVNKFQWFATIQNDFFIESQPVYLLTKKMGNVNGFLLFAGNENGTSNTGASFSKTILISRPGQLPYTSVSRKKYLLTFLKNKAVAQKVVTEGILKRKLRNDVEEEAYKNQQLEKEINKPGNELAKEKATTNFLRGYTTEKQRQQKDLEKTEEVYQKNIKAAADYLKNTAVDELEKPAFVQNTSYSYSFIKFASESEGQMLVQVNNNYFNTRLPPYVPQFLIVYWNWNTEKPSVDFANHIENNLNLIALQALLDK